MEYLSIRTATLRGDQKVSFDAFIFIAGKYITFVRKGDSFEGRRLERLKSKKVKKMFIREDQEQSYQNYLSENIDLAYDRSRNRSIESRTEVIQGALQSTAEDVMENPTDQATYCQARENADRYVEFLLKEEDAVRTILGIENLDQDIAHHGVSVATLSVAIAKRIGLPDENLTKYLALGALIHDLGHSTALHGAYLPLSSFIGPDRIAFMKHPNEGGERIKGHHFIDQAVIQIMTQHEEMIDGSGYPNGLLEDSTNPLSVIVSTANDFDRYSIIEKLGHAKAAEKFILARSELHPTGQLAALKSV